MKAKNLDLITVGGGCFWCIEAVFNEIKGVEKVVAGYSGGAVPGRPTYREDCSGLTGCAEVIQATFNPQLISYESLLTIFMTSHDPTTFNRQGGDIGSQYRSVIYYHSEVQRVIAKEVIKQVSPYFEEPIITEISAAQTFHKAEEYHQSYYAKNKTEGYCKAVISPILVKLRKLHSDKLRLVFA